MDTGGMAVVPAGRRRSVARTDRGLLRIRVWSSDETEASEVAFFFAEWELVANSAG